MELAVYIANNRIFDTLW